MNMEAQIRQIEENLCKKEIRNFYQDIKRENKCYQPKVFYCKDKEGNLIGDQQASVKRWAEYLEELLNEHNTDQDISEFSNDRREDKNEISEPDVQEIREILKPMKNNKAPGSNEKRPEMLKYGGEEFVQEIHRLIVECRKSEKIPEQWEEAVLCPILKKSDNTKCENYARNSATRRNLQDTSYMHKHKVQTAYGRSRRRIPDRI